MKKIRRRWVALLCAAAMCVTFTPITASATPGSSAEAGAELGDTVFGARKALDLQSAGASVTFTEAEKEANLQQAADEYDTILSETLDLFEPAYDGMAKYIQSEYGTAYGIELLDSSGNPYEDWPARLADAAADNTGMDLQAIVKEASEAVKNADTDTDYITAADSENFSNAVDMYVDNADASNISGSRMEKYLRYRYFNMVYLYNTLLSVDYLHDPDRDFNTEFVRWYENYENLKALQEDPSSNEARSNYIQKRAVQLNSETINEKLQSVLSNARFDFYLEKFDSDEEDANGIGDEITYDGQDLQVYSGGFEDSSADSVHLTYVDFSNEDQFYDSDLWDALPDFGDTISDPSGIMQGDEIVDGLSLGDYFLLFDGGSLESAGSPYTHMIGGVTYSASTIWPYESATRGVQDINWNAESLADYDIFGDGLIGNDHQLEFNQTNESGSYFSAAMYIPLTGSNVYNTTGYDIYIPEFDDDGNIVSISKPLFNELRDPEDSAKDPDQFDRDTLISSLDLDTDDDGTNDAGIYRYKMVEKNESDARVNGEPVVASDDYQIFDVVVDENGDVHFFLSDDIDDVDETYSAENVTYESELGAIGYGLTIYNYAAEGSTTLQAKKTVDGGIPDSDQTFEFELIDDDGNVVSTGTSTRGSVTFDPITFTGDDMGKTLTYTMVEVKDSGSGGSYIYDRSYYIAEVTVGDSVDEDGNIIGTTVVYKDSEGNVLDGLPVFENETTTETTSAPTGSITVHKTLDTYDADMSIFDQEDLTLYGFTLYAKNDIVSPADGTTVLYKAGTAVSAEVSCDENGNAEISGILPGEYVLKETKMPEGTAAVTSEPEIKVVADDSDSVSVYVNGEKQSSTDVINFENYVSKTDIQKKDESGAYLEGATLQIIDYDTGEVQDTWVTGTTAHKVAGLELGHTYTLREIDAPDGYEIADDITFVPEGAAVQTITMTDSKTAVTTDEGTDDTGDTEDNTGDNNTTSTDTTTDTSTDTGSGNGTTIVNTTSSGGTVGSTGSSTGTSDNSTTVQSVKTGDDSMLPETAAVTAAALAALAIIMAARKRKADRR